jgi:hypothetical protein
MATPRCSGALALHVLGKDDVARRRRTAVKHPRARTTHSGRPSTHRWPGPICRAGRTHTAVDLARVQALDAAVAERCTHPSICRSCRSCRAIPYRAYALLDDGCAVVPVDGFALPAVAHRSLPNRVRLASAVAAVPSGQADSIKRSEGALLAQRGPKSGGRRTAFTAVLSDEPSAPEKMMMHGPCLRSPRELGRGVAGERHPGRRSSARRGSL